jgi:hypothetical protein
VQRGLTREDSAFTFAFERIQSKVAESAAESLAADGIEVSEEVVQSMERGAWMSPIPEEGEEPARVSNVRRRLTDKGFLPMGFDEYLLMLEWTGRELKEGKRDPIPAGLSGILQRLHVRAETWTETVKQFGRWFHRVAGRAETVQRRAARAGKRWYQGGRHCRLAFG